MPDVSCIKLWGKNGRWKVHCSSSSVELGFLTLINNFIQNNLQQYIYHSCKYKLTKMVQVLDELRKEEL